MKGEGLWGLNHSPIVANSCHLNTPREAKPDDSFLGAVTTNNFIVASLGDMMQKGILLVSSIYR